MSKEHKSFIQNYLETVNHMKSLLINHCVQSNNEEGIVYMDQEFSDEGVATSYFVGEEKVPRCKIVANNKGLYFYGRRSGNS